MFPRMCDRTGPQKRKVMEDVTKQVSNHIHFRRVRDFHQFPQRSGKPYAAVKKSCFAYPCLTSRALDNLHLSLDTKKLRHACSYRVTGITASVLKVSAASASYYNLNLSFLTIIQFYNF